MRKAKLYLRPPWSRFYHCWRNALEMPMSAAKDAHGANDNNNKSDSGSDSNTDTNTNTDTNADASANLRLLQWLLYYNYWY